jgi:predicted RND superfamily exporter protein
MGIFRSLAGFFLPVLVVIATILSTFGAMALTGSGIDIVNVNLPLLILTMGIASAIHIMVEFYHYRREGYTPKDASRKTIESLFIPCFLTTLTTAVGFLSLYSSAMPPIQNFGLWGAFAVSLAYLYSVLTLPALLSFVSKVPHKRAQPQSLEFLAKFFDKLVAFLEVRGKQVLMGYAVVFAIAAAFSTQITVDYHYINAFKKDTRVRQDIGFFDESFGGVPNFEIVLDSGKEKGIFDKGFIEKASRLEAYIAAIPDMGKTTSPLPVLNTISGLRARDESDSSRELGLAEDFRRLLQQKASGDIYSFVASDERFMRIQITMPILPTSRTTAMLNDIRTVSAREYPELKVEVTGGYELTNHLNQYIREGMLTSFGLTLAFIFVSMLFVQRSVKFALMAAIPAVTSVVIAGGVMAAFDIYLDLTNMIVAAVTLGIADDDAIHIITRYRNARQSGMSGAEATKTALNESGKGVIYTSLILIAGFSILMTSSFIPNIHYGLLSVVVITFALIASVVVLPALLLHYEGAFVNRNVRKQTREEIPSKLETIGEGVFAKGTDCV